MTFRETIDIEERLTVYIRNNETGKIKEYVIKKPWKEMSLWEKILHWTHIRRRPGTISTAGKEAVARLYGGVAGGTHAVIDRVSHNSGGWIAGNAKTCVIAEPATGTVTYTNEATPWAATTAATSVGLVSSGYDYTLPYHTITLAGTLKTSSDYNWWVKIELTIS